jgi:hypothetical protein
MRGMKSVIYMALAVAILCGVARVAVLRRQAAGEAERKAASPRARNAVRPAEPRVAIPATRQRPLAQANRTSPVTTPRTGLVGEDRADVGTQKAAPANGGAQNMAQADPTTRPAQEEMKDPAARVALGFVGADPVAEEFWYRAINDPSLPAQERQDLIEDLNEDGLSDPENPTADDLPLILNRIQLLEAIVWDAMDEVNADAFQEAYKDLVNLAILALGGER